VRNFPITFSQIKKNAANCGKEVINVLRRYGLLDPVDEIANSIGLPEVRLADQVLQPKRLLAWGGVAALFMFVLTPFWDGHQQIYWVGFAFALFGTFFISAINLRNRVKQHTFDLINRTRFHNLFIESSRAIHMPYLNVKRISKRDAKRIYTNPNKGDVEFRKALTTVFNIYEVMALSVFVKDANERIIAQYYKDMLLSEWEKFQNVLVLYRKEIPSAYLYVEWLVNRWSESETS